MTKTPRTGVCSICNKIYDNWGNNPSPLGRIEDRCCNDCNYQFVIPARLKRIAQNTTQLTPAQVIDLIKEKKK